MIVLGEKLCQLMDITNAVLYEKYKRKQQKTEWVKIGDVWIFGKVTEGKDFLEGSWTLKHKNQKVL